MLRAFGRFSPEKRAIYVFWPSIVGNRKVFASQNISELKNCAAVFYAAVAPGAALFKKWQLPGPGLPKYAGAGAKKEGPCRLLSPCVCSVCGLSSEYEPVKKVIIRNKQVPCKS